MRVSHVGVRVSHVGVRVSHVGVRVSHVGVRVGHVGERASHVGVRVGQCAFVTLSLHVHLSMVPECGVPECAHTTVVWRPS